MLTRNLVSARTKLVHITTELSNQIRALMKTFGLVIPPDKGSKFEANVRELVIDREVSRPLCCHFWNLGAAPACMPLSSGVSSLLAHAKAKRVRFSC